MLDQVKPIKPPKIIQFFATIFLGAAGIALIFCALYTPPIGEIHPSVLTAFGMILTFVASYLGIDYASQLKFFKFASEFKEFFEPKRNRKSSKQQKLSDIQNHNSINSQL